MSDNFKFAQLQPFQLAGAGAVIGDTSIVLSSMTDIDGNALSMSGDFGTIGYGTIEPGTSDQEEQISFTGLTNNSNGTTTLTGVKNVDFLYPYTETSGLAKTHAGGVTFVISNTSGFYNKLTGKDDDETINGLWDFTQLPTSSATPINSNDLATKAYVDATATGTTSINRIVVAGTAGETISAGQLVYQKAADNRWWLCDADTAATVDNVNLGLAQGAGTAGNAISGGVLISGLDSNQTGLTADTKYYASNTAGGISTSAGTTEVSIGFSQSTTSILFTPRFDQQLTEDQQDALAGDNGTPSSSNKFVTQSGFQAGTEVYGADSVGTDAYAISPTPAVSAYSAGMRFMFKAGTANTGAATLAVGSGAAKAIVKLFNTALVTGDILQNQVVEVAYNSTNDNWQMISPVASDSISIAKSGTFTKDPSSSTADVIAHGLGKTPKLVRATMQGFSGTNAAFITSTGVFDGTNNNYVAFSNRGGSGIGGNNTSFPDSGGTYAVVFLVTTGNTNSGAITVDATNITFTWTIAGTPTGSMSIMWEAIG